MLISKNSTVIHHKLTLVFQNGQKSLFFYQKFHLYFSWAMSPMCNNVPNVQHFFGEFRCCTLGASSVLIFISSLISIFQCISTVIFLMWYININIFEDTNYCSFTRICKQLIAVLPDYGTCTADSFFTRSLDVIKFIFSQKTKQSLSCIGVTHAKHFLIYWKSYHCIDVFINSLTQNKIHIFRVGVSKYWFLYLQFLPNV